MKQDLKHIVYLVSTLGNSGPTRQLLYLIKNLDFSLFRVSLVTLSTEPEASLKPKFLELPVDIHCLSASKRKNILSLYLDVRRFLHDSEADVLHSQGLRGDICSALYRGPILRVATQRNDPFEDYPPLYGMIIGRVAAIVHVVSLRRLDQVVTVSRTLAEQDAARRINAKFIRNGVPSAIDSPTEKRRFNSGSSSVVESSSRNVSFVYAGPLVKRKNPEVLIRAFSSPDMAGYRLLMLGDGPLLAKCRSLAQNSPNIAVMGAVEDIGVHLQRSSCYISASLSEGLPNSVLEALRAGRPAILSDIPAHRELHSIAQGVVTLFRSGDEAYLRQKVKDFQTDLRISDLAVSVVSKHFDEKIMSRLYQELYLDILDTQTASQNTDDTAQ